MGWQQNHPSAFGFELSDGNRWRFVAEDGNAQMALAEMARRMRLDRLTRATQTVRLVTGDRGQREPLTIRHDGRDLHIVLKPVSHRCDLLVQLQALAMVIAGRAEVGGAVLLHGALAELDGSGVVLAGPGGVGKTTASRRLRPPWRSLSDDTTLVVRDGDGDYRAHPWPTWGRLFESETDESWEFRRSVPLAGIFFLVQDEGELVRDLSQAAALCMMSESVQQVARVGVNAGSRQRERRVRLRRFDNLTPLIGTVRCHLLHLSLTGPFWIEIEKALGWSSPQPWPLHSTIYGSETPA